MAVSAKDQLAQMARYHAWATERLLASVAPIPDEFYRKPCGLFFGSIHGTLNHLLLTDSEIWFPRFAQNPITSLPLDAELESDRTALASRMTAAAARWSGYLESLSESALAGDLRFTMTTGQARFSMSSIMPRTIEARSPPRSPCWALNIHSSICLICSFPNLLSCGGQDVRSHTKSPRRRH